MLPVPFLTFFFIQRIVPKEPKRSIGDQSKEISPLLYCLFCYATEDASYLILNEMNLQTELKDQRTQKNGTSSWVKKPYSTVKNNYFLKSSFSRILLK